MKKITSPETPAIEFIFTETCPKEAVQTVFTEKKRDELITSEHGIKTLHFGIGARPLSRREFILLPRKVTLYAKSHRIPSLFLDITEILSVQTSETLSVSERIELFTTNAEMANFEFIRYKTAPEEGWNFVQKIAYGNAREHEKIAKEAVRRGKIIAGEVNRARMLSNIPGGEMTPKLLAGKAKEAIQGTSIKLKLLGRVEMKKLGMGALLGVAQGSVEEPQLIVMEYMGGKGKEQPVVLAGKGITFDTGGLNLKPSNAIYEMHMDMSGGAAVIASIVAAAKLGIKKNIVGLIPAAENMPSGSSYRPGDVLKSMSGKTIEITNTDAEGRVVLADALTYAERYKPRAVVDIATLTGAAMVALGTHASAIFSKDTKMIELLQTLGEKSGDYVWPLPLWDEYASDIRGTFGDVVNSGKSRYGGAIEGAMFLYQFTKEYPKETVWAHIDMAPRMTATEGDHLAKGAAGAPVRLLIHLLETY